VESETVIYAEADGGVKPWSERLQDVQAINAYRNQKVKIELECKRNNVSATNLLSNFTVASVQDNQCKCHIPC
jgi:hypothetical protein